MKKLSLVVEQSKDGKIWGRVEINEDLIVDSANSVEILERKMKKHLQKFHRIEPSNIQFQLVHDLSALFAQKDYLNISAIASKAGINPSLMRQYVSGFKYPSPERTMRIEKIINSIGQELSEIKLSFPKKRTTPLSKNTKPGARVY